MREPCWDGMQESNAPRWHPNRHSVGVQDCHIALCCKVLTSHHGIGDKVLLAAHGHHAVQAAGRVRFDLADLGADKEADLKTVEKGKTENGK